jgi:hypothetical protein
MTMLTHTGGPFKPARDSSTAQEAAGTAAASARMAMVKQFCVHALTVVIAGVALAGIIALKAAIFLSRVSY